MSTNPNFPRGRKLCITAPVQRDPAIGATSTPLSGSDTETAQEQAPQYQQQRSQQRSPQRPSPGPQQRSPQPSPQRSPNRSPQRPQYYEQQLHDVGGESAVSQSAATASKGKCPHPGHSLEPRGLSSEEFLDKLEERIEKGSCSNHSTIKINAEMNRVYLERLTDIDERAQGDTDLKLQTYMEWVNELLETNECVISNVADLEREVTERLELVQRNKANSNCRHSQGNELSKCRKDICSLLKVIQNAYYNNNWSILDMQFETLTHADVLGLSETQARTQAKPQIVPDERCKGPAEERSKTSDSAMKDKLLGNVRALAVEVADKHDEIRELKRQICALDDDIQNAQMKIQLKDDVIKELRCDLRNINAKLSEKSCCSSDTVKMTPVNLEMRSTTSGTFTNSAETECTESKQVLEVFKSDISPFESLSHTETVENEKLKTLEVELSELFELTKDLKKQNLEYHRKRLSEIFKKMEEEKNAVYRKLDFMRRRLTDLECTNSEAWKRNWNDYDDAFYGSKCENDPDVRILRALSRRLSKLSDNAMEQQKRVQALDLENNELLTTLETEKIFAERNANVLKELADLMSRLTGKDFSYEEIYDNQCKKNPFCEAILDLRKVFMEREADFVSKMEAKREQIAGLEAIFCMKQADGGGDPIVNQAPSKNSSVDTTYTTTPTTPSMISSTTPATLATTTLTTTTLRQDTVQYQGEEQHQCSIQNQQTDENRPKQQQKQQFPQQPELPQQSTQQPPPQQTQQPTQQPPSQQSSSKQPPPQQQPPQSPPTQLPPHQTPPKQQPPTQQPATQHQPPSLQPPSQQPSQQPPSPHQTPTKRQPPKQTTTPQPPTQQSTQQPTQQPTHQPIQQTQQHPPQQPPTQQPSQQPTQHPPQQPSPHQPPKQQSPSEQPTQKPPQQKQQKEVSTQHHSTIDQQHHTQQPQHKQFPVVYQEQQLQHLPQWEQKQFPTRHEERLPQQTRVAQQPQTPYRPQQLQQPRQKQFSVQQQTTTEQQQKQQKERHHTVDTPPPHSESSDQKYQDAWNW